MIHLITVGQISYYTGLLWLLLCAVWLGSAPFVKPTLQRQSAESRLQQTIIFGIGLYMLFGSPAYPEWFNQPLIAVTIPVALTGLALVLLGVAFSCWARLTLGENWSASPTIKQDHALVMRGPYRIVRHPIYTGLLTGLVGSALQHGLVRSFLAVLVCVVSLWIKIAAEEHFMIQRFGDQYRRYARHVSALVPFVF
jgi:protein-S-isoprenylcysteine O-methyltransferase Ste14